MWGHQVSDQRAGEPMCDDRQGRDQGLERKLARLAEDFDPVPSSVLDDARAALSARVRTDHAAESPELASEDLASEDLASEDRDPASGPRDA